MEKIRIATANRGAGTAPVFATVEGGYFRDEGLEVALIRTDAAFGQTILRTYTRETDAAVLEATYVLFTRLMGAMMYPSVEGVRAAATMVHRLGVIDRLPAPDEFIDLNLIARLETEGLFRRLLGVA